MMGATGGVRIAVGARLLFQGDAVQVASFDGRTVVLQRERGGRVVSVSLAVLAAGASVLPQSSGQVSRPAGDGEPLALDAGADAGLGVGAVALAALDAGQLAVVAARAGHVREVLTGFRSGDCDRAEPGEPRAAYGAGTALKARYAAKAEELGVRARTVENWVAAYRAGGEAGLVDARTVRRQGSGVDPRWDAAVRAVLAEGVKASTPTRSAVLAKTAARLESQYGPGVVAAPTRATAYRRLAVLAKGTNAVCGSAKARRSIADRPVGAYGRLRAVRPGEYVILDTQDLDVFAMEPVTCRWVRAQLTVAQDLFSRCIVGLRVTAVSTKAVDVAGVLLETVAAGDPDPLNPITGSTTGSVSGGAWAAGEADVDGVDAGRLGPYHGVPGRLVFTEVEAAGHEGVWCPPETLVVDHGRAFLSVHVIGVCARLGISIQPAQPHKPTDKPTVERFFKTLREGLVQHLPAYKGPDLHSRGERVEDEAFLFLHELEAVIREWVATVYHLSPHDGLVVAAWPGTVLSPREMFEVGVATAGVLRIPASPQLAYEFLAVVWRTIQHYGVEVGGLRYNGPGLDGYRNLRSPYRGIAAGKWPIRVNPDDVRWVYFQDPDDAAWHRLDWEHAPLLGAPFSAEAARHARVLAARADRFTDPAQALGELLARWETGAVTGARERRMALRLSSERAALPPMPTTATARSLDEGPDDGLGPAGPGTSGGRGGLRAVAGEATAGLGAPVLEGDDDDGEELFDAPDDELSCRDGFDEGADSDFSGDFYGDAFEVLE